jgi:hypothetical protein
VTTKWLSGAKVMDLSGSRGNGPFRDFLGVCIHVNVDENGTPDSFWRNNPGQVTPNFQIYKDGSVHQILPFNWQPWCQVDGNFNYAAIEFAGMPNEPMTHAQLVSGAKILRVYHNEMDMALKLANHPGERGLAGHRIGGISWGGHSCPGDVRMNQRDDMLKLVVPSHEVVPPHKPGKPYLRHAWPSWMGSGHLFGNLHGPDWMHGGINTRERAAVMLIQRRFQALGFAPKTAGWADGLWEAQTDAASVRWHRAHKRPSHPASVGPTDWHYLFTY